MQYRRECEIDHCAEDAEFEVTIANLYQKLCLKHTKRTVEMLKEGMFSGMSADELTVRLLNGYAGRTEQ